MKIKETDCDNNRESIEETLTNTPDFKSISLFEGIERLASFPLHSHQDYYCDPYKNKKELFEALDSLNNNNIESEDFFLSNEGIILYRMFPSDYSCDFKIDGIATDDFGRQFVLVCFDDNQNTNVPATIDSDGMLISKENPEVYKDLFSKERKIAKDKIRLLLKRIAKLNSDINDLSIYHDTSYDEHMREKQEVEELKEEVWTLYNNSLSKGELSNDTESGLPLTGSLDMQENTKPGPKKQKLFMSEKTKSEDTEAKNKEKERFLNYLKEHKIGNKSLSCQKDDLLNAIIVCFVKIWIEKGLITQNPSGPSIYRFLTEDCNKKSEVTEKSYANKINDWLKENPYDVKIEKSVRRAF